MTEISLSFQQQYKHFDMPTGFSIQPLKTNERCKKSFIHTSQLTQDLLEHTRAEHGANDITTAQ